MDYKPALYDDSEPAYAPGMAAPVKGLYYWKAPGKYRKLGYEPTSVRLAGRAGDGLDLVRAAEARRLTRAMVERFSAKAKPPVRSWADLIGRYVDDDVSPIRDVKGSTREDYAWLLGRWATIIGTLPIAALDYEAVKTIESGMKANGRSVSYVHRMFTMLRTVAGYGVAIKVAGARDVADVLGQIRFKMPPRREVYPAREQVVSIIRHADATGLRSFATGLLIQWTYALRAVDVRGQWLPGPGGIMRNGEHWADGLTWDMVEPDLGGFSKVISKTARQMPWPTRFDLAVAPQVQERLAAMKRRPGPVIVSERTGLPYTVSGWSRTFRRLADELGLPREIMMMDTRAGALTEGRGTGADREVLRDAAGHMDASTTDRYLRNRESNIVKLAEARSKIA